MSMIVVQGLKSAFVMTAGYGGTAQMTVLDLGRSVGMSDGAVAKGFGDATARGGAG